MNVIQNIKNDMVCGNGCPMYHKSHYDIGKCTCHKKQVIVEIIRRSEDLSAVKAERDKLNTKIKQYKDALELAVRYNRKGELLNKLALALESDGE